MANKNSKEIRFTLTDDDYKAFGRYRVLYTAGGKKIVMRQRLTYLVSGIIIAALFTVFHVDANFTKLAYVVAAVIGIGGFIFADKMILRQQDKVIEADKNSAERVHSTENIIKFEDELFKTKAGDDEQEFAYKDIQQVDMTDDSIYVWISDTMIMPLPLHAFKGQMDMENTYNYLMDKIGAKSENGD